MPVYKAGAKKRSGESLACRKAIFAQAARNSEPYHRLFTQLGCAFQQQIPHLRLLITELLDCREPMLGTARVHFQRQILHLPRRQKQLQIGSQKPG
jgi:hypothetical protein